MKSSFDTAHKSEIKYVFKPQDSTIPPFHDSIGRLEVNAISLKEIKAGPSEAGLFIREPS